MCLSAFALIQIGVWRFPALQKYASRGHRIYNNRVAAEIGATFFSLLLAWD